MICPVLSANIRRLSKEAGPAFLILILSMVFSIFSGQFAFLRGWESLYRGLLRFFRTTLFLCLPLFLLPSIFGNLGSLIRRRKEIFIQIRREGYSVSVAEKRFPELYQRMWRCYYET